MIEGGLRTCMHARTLVCSLSKKKIIVDRNHSKIEPFKLLAGWLAGCLTIKWNVVCSSKNILSLWLRKIGNVEILSRMYEENMYSNTEKTERQRPSKYNMVQIVEMRRKWVSNEWIFLDALYAQTHAISFRSLSLTLYILFCGVWAHSFSVSLIFPFNPPPSKSIYVCCHDCNYRNVWLHTMQNSAPFSRVLRMSQQYIMLHSTSHALNFIVEENCI